MTPTDAPYTIYHQSRNRKTGSLIQIVDNRDYNFTRWRRELADPNVRLFSPYDYVTYCVKHDTWVEHHSLKDAGNHYAHPEGWCDDCAGIIEGSEEDPPPHRVRTVAGFDPALAPEIPDEDLFS